MCFTGNFHAKLMEAYIKALEERTIGEVDYTLKLGKDELPICVKIQYFDKTGEIISKMKKLNEIRIRCKENGKDEIEWVNINKT